MRTSSKTLFGFAAWLLAVGPVVAQQGGSAPQMSPEEQAMMAAMEKAATPGAEHAWLAAMAGGWDFTASFWMRPGDPPTTSTGRAERSMMLGGRVMVEKVTSEMMGQPFEGFGMMGFDNVGWKYWGTWNDNMTTGVMSSTGTCRNSKCEFQSTAYDPVTGKLMTARTTSEHAADREVHAMYSAGPDGKEFKTMELVYTRRK